MSLQEIATKLVQLCNEGRADEAMQELYSPDIVSIEAQDVAGMPARLEGLDAVVKKGEWWSANHEVHSMTAEGPFIGNRPDQFAVLFTMDATPVGGQRMLMSEVALYTVRDGRIVQEEFLYRA
ncbi:MAG TPA: nuclear transport factor 2 family protein [Pseudomonadales bacterium]